MNKKEFLDAPKNPCVCDGRPVYERLLEMHERALSEANAAVKWYRPSTRERANAARKQLRDFKVSWGLSNNRLRYYCHVAPRYDIKCCPVHDKALYKFKRRQEGEK